MGMGKHGKKHDGKDVPRPAIPNASQQVVGKQSDGDLAIVRPPSATFEMAGLI